MPQSPHHHRAQRCTVTRVTVAAMLCLVAVGAQAQLVPRGQHVLRSAGGSEYTFNRISLSHGLIPGVGSHRLGSWPSWEGRVGVMMDRRTNPLKDTYVLFQPVYNGLNIRGMHVLSDFYLDGGFRATAGMVRGAATQTLWDGGGEGLNVSVQRLDSLNIPGAASRVDLDNLSKTSVPYFGAGYSTRVNSSGLTSRWRFNADLGLISINQNNFGRISRTLAGEQALSDLVRELKLRPLLKFSMGYSF